MKASKFCGYVDSIHELLSDLARDGASPLDVLAVFDKGLQRATWRAAPEDKTETRGDATGLVGTLTLRVQLEVKR